MFSPAFITLRYTRPDQMMSTIYNIRGGDQPPGPNVITKIVMLPVGRGSCSK